MCLANSARSQIAEGLANNLLPTNFIVQSAGSHPTTVNSFAIKVMQEINIDISRYHSKSYDALPNSFKENLDLVITLCKEEICPILPGNVKHLKWPFEDPVGNFNNNDDVSFSKFGDTRDKIKEKILYIESILKDEKN